MGHMIGMPCLKLNNIGRKSAKCGSFGSVAAEALEERHGRDGDIDLTKTGENLYSGFSSADELQAYSREHVAALSAKLRAEGKRGIRSDAVVMCATIIKPPAAYMNELTREEQIRFLQDADAKLNELIGGAQNSKSTVIHLDEQGAHLHKFWEPMTEDGRLCAKEMMNLQFFSRLNKEMPEYMRARGWDIEDCRAYDEAAEKLKTEQEKAEERERRGRTSVQFKAEAEAEKNKICAEIDDLKVEKTGLEEELEDLRDQKADLQEEIEAKEEELQEVSEPVMRLIGESKELDERVQHKGKKHVVSDADYQKLIQQSKAAEAQGFVLDKLKSENVALRAEKERISRRYRDLDHQLNIFDRFKEAVEAFLERFKLREAFDRFLHTRGVEKPLDRDERAIKEVFPDEEER